MSGAGADCLARLREHEIGGGEQLGDALDQVIEDLPASFLTARGATRARIANVRWCDASAVTADRCVYDPLAP